MNPVVLPWKRTLWFEKDYPVLWKLISFEYEKVLGQKILYETKWALQKPGDHFFVLCFLTFTLQSYKCKCFQLESLYFIFGNGTEVKYVYLGKFFQTILFETKYIIIYIII